MKKINRNLVGVLVTLLPTFNNLTLFFLPSGKVASALLKLDSGATATKSGLIEEEKAAIKNLGNDIADKAEELLKSAQDDLKGFKDKLSALRTDYLVKLSEGTSLNDVLTKNLNLMDKQTADMFKSLDQILRYIDNLIFRQ
jgi:hypothetical protein